MEEVELSLRDLIEIILRRRNLVIAFAVVAILLASIYSFFIARPVYEGRLVLMASGYSDRVQDRVLDNTTTGALLDSLSRFPSMTLETFRQMAKSPQVLQLTIEDLGLEAHYSVERLAKAVTVEGIRDTNLLALKMTHADANVASQIINRLGENFVDFISEKAREHAARSAEYVESQMAVEKQKYDLALEELKNYLSKPRGVSELSQELTTVLTQVTDYKRRLTDLDIRREALGAAIRVAAQMERTTRLLLVGESSGTSGATEPKEIVLVSTEAMLRIELAEVESNIGQLGLYIPLLQKELEGLQAELEEKKHQEQLITHRVSVAKSNYDAFVKKHGELLIAESTRVGDATLTVVSQAVPASTPVGGRRALILAIALILGTMSGMFVAFFMEYWQATDPRRLQSQ